MRRALFDLRSRALVRLPAIAKEFCRGSPGIDREVRGFDPHRVSGEAGPFQCRRAEAERLAVKDVN